MKKKIIKSIKVLFTFISLLLLVFGIAISWPLPNFKTPKKYPSTLIKSINLIDVKSGEILSNRTILIKDNIIISIDTLKYQVQEADLVIEGKGKYIIPGLWDMHTHSNQHSEWLHHPLYIANGITGIRDMSGQLNKKDSYWVGSEERLKWNEEVNKNLRVAPKYVLQSSYQMDGSSSVPDNYSEYFKLQKNDDVDSVLNFYKNKNVDFIKVYQQISPSSYKRLATQAPKHGLHLAGHKPIFISLEEAIKLGQRSFEHGRVFMYEAFPKADSLRISKDWIHFFQKSKNSMVNDFNIEKAAELMHLMKEYNAYWTPTLQTLKFEALAHKDSFLSNPNLKYISWVRKKLWWGFDVNRNKKQNTSLANKGLSASFYEASKKQLSMANKIGVPIMAGTDVTDSYTFAGFSIHDELEELTKSGFSNLEALRSATIIPAQFANMENKYGTIENGKIADLVILDKNPLKKITNSKSINSVILNGTYYSSSTLQELKDFTQSIASSFHMNVKVMYSFISSPLIRVQFAD
ncbi:amidohydrolase family protein [Croceitalea sp. MTPC9]|uniref:amidohydrolase family protein n=1 Tax=unclassified Croceitalea TaxID=2632280 RepID=UPI002B3B9B15|nr:amidohydrolase family protein [Croceitalea sp. MTPC6]GMN16071.1 amidohydrolase family protein [Croceitalea sp. MTPC9]